MTKKKQPRAKRRPRNFLQSRTFLAGALLTLGGIAAAGAVFAFRGDDAPKRALRQDPVVSTERQVEVIVDNRDYTPRDLTVTKGATVTWTFKDDVPHNVVDDRGAFDSGILKKGDSWSLTAETPGTYYYYCTLHHIMQGTLVVVE
ncbi:MAG TPA: plastocyanin/azurin family copper-binding protein [Dehalococcoidia bacterium]|nr:plastocyanin/azurin family copper-binding protein [Dehalococcoidia bacterium]